MQKVILPSNQKTNLQLTGMANPQTIILTHTDQVASAFDEVAEIFDSTFESSPVIQNIRQRVYNEIQRRVLSGSLILDINCGTGIDAIFLAKKGYAVHGIDISAKMIEQARKKADAEQIGNVEFFVSSFEHLPTQLTQRYDLVLSNFGGLNCTNNLDKVAEEIAAITKQGGFFIGIVMPPFCIWETASGLLHGRWRYAFRRLRKNTAATGFYGKGFIVFYHSPQHIVSAFRPRFQVKQIVGLSVSSPPPAARRFIEHYPRLTSFLERFDESVEKFPLIRSIGDHFMIVLKRRNGNFNQ